MYVCLCNGFTDREIRRTAEASACSVSEIYRALGSAPKCGKCVPFVRDLLKSCVAPALALSETG